MKKKTILFVVMILISSLLVGFGTEGVTLFHKDQKVIDLQKAIEIARPGGNEESEEESTEEPEQEKEETDDTEEDDDPEDDDTEYSINIIVSGRDIEIDGEKINSTEEVENRLEELYKTNVTFELIDNYAEAHVYKDLISILQKLHEEIGLNYEIQ